MSQYDFGNIDPATKSGDQLATDLNNWRNALNSLHRGATRPTYAQAGTVWIDDHVSPWTVKLYSGSADIAIGTVDPTSGAFVAANSDKLGGYGVNGFATAAQGAKADAALPATGTAVNASKLGGELPSHYQAALGYTPVQQGTGTGQGGNQVKIGWNNVPADGSVLKLEIDSVNFGANWPINITGTITPGAAGSAIANQNTGDVGTYALLSCAGAVAPGDIIAGSSLAYAAATGGNNLKGSSPTGSWQACGYSDGSPTQGALIVFRRKA